MPKLTKSVDDWGVKSRPRVPISKASHTELKVMSAVEEIPVGVLADQLIQLGLKAWNKKKGLKAS